MNSIGRDVVTRYVEDMETANERSVKSVGQALGGAYYKAMIEALLKEAGVTIEEPQPAPPGGRVGYWLVRINVRPWATWFWTGKVWRLSEQDDDTDIDLAGKEIQFWRYIGGAE